MPPEKIEANELHPAQVEFLKPGSSRAPLVEQYLTNALVLPTHADEIAQAVSTRYRVTAAGADCNALTCTLAVVLMGQSSNQAVSDRMALLQQTMTG